MLRSIINDIKSSFHTGNMVTRLIIINVAVFMILALIGAFAGEQSSIYKTIFSFVAISSEPMELVFKPWTLITHMFVHEGGMHLFWNMILLYWFGIIVGDLLGDKRVFPIYLLGGIMGGMVYFISAQLFENVLGGYAIGASAAMLAILMTAAAVAPNYNIRLILLGNVKIKYIALFALFLDVIGIKGMSNTGGHFGHLGGASFGFLFVYLLRHGTDLSIPVNRWLDMFSNLFTTSNRSGRKQNKPKSKLKVVSRSDKLNQFKNKLTNVERDLPFQERLDAILDKIKKKGYDSLDEEEKEFLFQASKK